MSDKPSPRLRTLRQRRARFRAMLAVFALIGAVVAAMPSMIVITIGLVPTLTWFIVDMTQGRYACRCIAGFNIAGVTPYLYKLWAGQNNIAAAVSIVSDPFALFVFYGAATLGFLLFMGLPGIVAMIKTLNAERQVRQLRDEQRDLIEEWGRSISGNAAPPGGDEDAERSPEAVQPQT